MNQVSSLTLKEVLAQGSKVLDFFSSEELQDHAIFTTLVCPSKKVESNQSKFAR